MNQINPSFPSIDMLVKQWISALGTVVEVFGVAVIIVGIVVSSTSFVRQREAEGRYEQFRLGIGRSLLLGIEILLAADIIKTIVFDLAFGTLGILAGLVLIRTFLSWSLVVEIEGRWPWQRRDASQALGSALEQRTPVRNTAARGQSETPD